MLDNKFVYNYSFSAMSFFKDFKSNKTPIEVIKSEAFDGT